MSRYDDDDLESVSTASCSDDDEIDNTAMEKMHCNFLQKQKSGILDGIITRRASSVFGAVGLAHVTPKPPPKTFSNVNNKLKEKLNVVRDAKILTPEAEPLVAAPNAATVSSPRQLQHRESMGSNDGPTGLSTGASSLAGSPTNAETSSPKSNRRGRMVTISSSNNMKAAAAESESNPPPPPAATAPGTAHSIGEMSLLSAVTSEGGSSMIQSSSTRDNEVPAAAGSTATEPAIVRTMESTASVTTDDQTEEEKPELTVEKEPKAPEEEKQTTTDVVPTATSESPATTTEEMVPHTPQRKAEEAGNIKKEEDALFSPKTPPPRQKETTITVEEGNQQQQVEHSGEAYTSPLTMDGNVRPDRGFPLPVMIGGSAAVRTPTPPLNSGSSPAPHRSPRSSGLIHSNVMSPVFGDVPTSLNGSSSGNGTVQQILASAMKQHATEPEGLTSMNASLASNVPHIKGIPAPPKFMAAGPSSAAAMVPSPTDNNTTNQNEADTPRVSEETMSPPQNASEAGTPNFATTIPRLAQSATAIYPSVSAALGETEEEDQAPHTGRSEGAESRDGESRCRDNSPPATPTIYKNEEEEEDTCGVVPSLPPSVAAVSAAASTTMASSPKQQGGIESARSPPPPPLPNNNNSSDHNSHVSWDAVGNTDVNGPLGMRLHAPVDADMEGDATPELPAHHSPRLLKRSGSAASSHNASPAHTSLYVPQIDESERQLDMIPKIDAEDFDAAPAVPSIFSQGGLLNKARLENVSANDIIKKEEEKEEAAPVAPLALSPALKQRRGNPARCVSREGHNHTAADPPSPHNTADGEDEEKHQPTKEELLRREKALQDRVTALKKLGAAPSSGALNAPKSARTLSMSPKPPARVGPLTAR